MHAVALELAGLAPKVQRLDIAPQSPANSSTGETLGWDPARVFRMPSSISTANRYFATPSSSIAFASCHAIPMVLVRPML